MYHKDIQFLLFVRLLRLLRPRQWVRRSWLMGIFLRHRPRRNESVDTDKTSVGKVRIGGSCILGQHVSESSPPALVERKGRRTATLLLERMDRGRAQLGGVGEPH
jgi:hypothetical protein